MSSRTILRPLALITILALPIMHCSFLSDVINSPIAPQQQESLASNPESCTGIEMMGLYKNEIFDRAMGGGVVEWLAKIRNNTGVTKIVQFTWRDSSSQQQRGQVQIQGGQIASPRVDMTQARPIPPVTGLRLLSCE
jgi:hypothetical protein